MCRSKDDVDTESAVFGDCQFLAYVIIITHGLMMASTRD